LLKNTEYKEDGGLRTTFRLTFLDSWEVSESLIEDFISLIPRRLVYCKYADYLTDNYLYFQK